MSIFIILSLSGMSHLFFVLFCFYCFLYSGVGSLCSAEVG